VIEVHAALLSHFLFFLIKTNSRGATCHWFQRIRCLLQAAGRLFCFRVYLNQINLYTSGSQTVGRPLFLYTPPFKSLASLRNVLVFERKAKKVSNQIDQKYIVDIVLVVNDCCGWKRLIKKKKMFNGISTEAHYQQTPLF
jgi:hypothetical protein